jgi:ribonucleotide reductase alpha subunit
MIDVTNRPFEPLIAPPTDIVLSDNSRQVLQKRYLRRGLDGKPAETIEGMFRRVARAVAEPDGAHGYDVSSTEDSFCGLLASRRFFPNSPTFTGAGTPLGQLAACFVLPISDDLGKNSDGIFQTLRDAALIQQTGGGNGFSFSRLRPKGDSVASSAGVATGPVGFLRTYDGAFGEVAQGGTRRGANMAVLRVDHPDIEAFVTCKAKEGDIANFNISVGITDAFMQAVEADSDFPLVNPRDGRVWRTVRARDLFNQIVTFAHHNGEPGALFLDAANRSNPVPHLYELEATNPCVPGDTLVATPSGWRRADTIRQGDEICTVLGTGRVERVEVNPAVATYRLNLSDGASLRATAAHQFHVRDSHTKFFEPRRLDQLKPGDWIRVYKGTLPNNPVPPTSVDLSDREHGFLVGVLVGDGCYTPHALSVNVVRLSTHADDTEWNEILLQAFRRVGVTKMYNYVNAGSRSMMMDPKPGRIITNWVKTLLLKPARGPEKELPEAYINSNAEFLTGLLDGLFSTDGSVDVQSNHPMLRFHTSSPELARQVRLILLMFGVHGRIAKSERKRHELDGRVIRYDRPKYDVIISGQSLGRFIEQIQLSHPAKQQRLVDAALRSNFTGGNWAAQVIAIETANAETVYDLYEAQSDTWITEGYVSRGCGEQWLGPYENCCLGSINLAEHVTDGDRVDWEKLRESTVVSTRFLDNVVDANKYVPAVPQLRTAALQARRIGLGIMGLGDMMYRLGVRYGSDEGQEFAAQVMEFVRYHCMATSVALAAERGPFGAIKGSIYDPANLRWQPPAPLAPYAHDWGRPALAWEEIIAGIKRHGIRNAAQTTVAPTGTIGTVAGCEGYGCEPVFALAYTRTVKDGDRDLKLTYTSPLFDRAMTQAGLDKATRDRIGEMVSVTGSCQDMPEVPAAIRRTFVVSQDITAEEHVRMQAAIQAFVDNSISKTINFMSSATVEDVKQAYLLAWKLGCKGLTVYVTGSRQEVVLETKATTGQKAKDGGAEESGVVAAPRPAAVSVPEANFQAQRRPRPSALPGTTYRKETPLGTAYITVNVNGHAQPFEVFLNVGKAGSDVAAVSEALGRLISLGLRLPSPLDPVERMKLVIDQLAGIGGGRSMGFGANRVRSLPDAVAQVLREHLNGHFNDEEAEENDPEPYVEQLPLPITDRPIGDLCPDCGQATFIPTEGCRKCYACGYSEC